MPVTRPSASGTPVRGRDSHRPRTARSATRDVNTRRPVGRAPEEPIEIAPDPPPKNRRDSALPQTLLGMSYRVVALIAVVAFLLISFVNSFSVYLRQERELADTRVAIAEHEAAIAELTDEVERWDDPAYVEAQARDRLGWVMPGETGYRIIGPDGSVIAGEVATIDGGSDTVPLLWYERLWGSVQVADQPAPAPTGAVEPTPAAVPTSEETPQ